MRIQNTTFLLTLSIKNANDNLSLEAYGSNFDLLTSEQTNKNGVDIIEISTYMPNTVTVVLFGNTMPIELVGMSLAGIPINGNILTDVIEYKPSEIPVQSVQECVKNTSVRRLVWDQPGCVLINLFDPNPFAYHMYIGNKIRF
jgi:hypothetical protein